MKNFKNFKQGVASFYIVAISTLILVIIAASFAAVIISEIARTSNDDLAQSAYDSALAGVEDAKLAYYNYRNCLENKSESAECKNIYDLVDNANKADEGEVDCDMVAKILGRTTYKENGEEVGVLVQETDTAGNNMQQAYTCVIFKTELDAHYGTLTSSNPTKVMRARFGNSGVAQTIKSIRVSWQADKDGTTDRYSDFGEDGIFGKDAPLPPVLSVGLIQTANSFKLSDFDVTRGDKTNRGTVYLVPTGSEDIAKGLEKDKAKYKGAWQEESGKWKNYINKTEGFLKSNDKTATNLPFAVYCNNESGAYACSAVIELPEPVGDGGRSDDTFMIALSMPYASSGTEVVLEFCKGNDECEPVGEKVGEEIVEKSTAVPLMGQVIIDSTGRANDLYRRVQTVLEPADDMSSYLLYAIELLGTDENGYSLKKDLSPTWEWGI